MIRRWPVPSDGERVARYLRVVRTHMDALDESFEAAVAAVVPSDLWIQVAERYEAQQTQPIRRTHVLSEGGGPRAWFGDYRPSDGYHWRRQRDYLIDQLGRSEVEVDLLDDASDKVLSYIEDPRITGPAEFRVIGLAIGYVQSGKTANYSALIAKAADLGYKLVIVLSGIHNLLRQQTQRRLAKELGLEPGPPGVGLPDEGLRWITLTTSEPNGDFRPGTSDPNVLQGNERVIMVVKKNATVLRRLVQWMDDRVPSALPVLIIDDEADQASINTGGNRAPVEELADLTDEDIGDVSPDQELNPSVINGLIRDLVSKFRRVSMVGYTATPFANMFIDPDAFDRLVEMDLYPRDFMLSLYRNPGYVGAERLFGRSELNEDDEPVDGLDVTELIPDQDITSLLPPRRSTNGWAPEMPESLTLALTDFILVAAARTVRLGRDDIASMLIHTSHRIWVQNLMGDLVRDEIRSMRREWRYGRTLEASMSSRWDTEFRPLTASLDISRDIPFSSIRDEVDRLFEHHFRDGHGVLVLNSSTDDFLDYDADSSQKLVLIGGNRLSRGLTLENLLVSYYAREAQTYDTLLQMGRWFGHREEYVDLTRLWTTEELLRRFRHLALVEEEMRDRVEVYEREGLTPLQFGVKIRSHPAMLATAANKMGSARRVLQSYSGERIQTTRFRLTDQPWLAQNLDATRDFLGGLGAPFSTESRPEWRGVDWSRVAAFLDAYQTVQDAVSIDASTVRRYIHKQATEHQELTEWHVAVRSLPTEDRTLGAEDLNIEGVSAVPCINRSRLTDDKDSIGALVSPARTSGASAGDEEVGLSREQIEAARSQYPGSGNPTIGHALRRQRSRQEGLILLYPISRYSQPGRTARNREPLFDDPGRGSTVIGVALVFPYSDTSATVEYYVGPAGLDEDDEYTE